MIEPQPKNRGGRPPKFPGEGPRTTHATRLRPSLAEKIATAASQNHRSIGEEIEHRLDLSFYSEEDIETIVEKSIKYKIKEMLEKIEILEEKGKAEEYDYRLLLANEKISGLSLRKLVLNNRLGFNSSIINLMMMKNKKSVVIERNLIKEQINDIDRRLEVERIELEVCKDWFRRQTLKVKEKIKYLDERNKVFEEENSWLKSLNYEKLDNDVGNTET